MFDNRVILGVGYSGGKDWFDETLANLSYRRQRIHVQRGSHRDPARAAAVRHARRRDRSPKTRAAAIRANRVPARTFGELRLTLTDWPLYVNVGRIDWGKQQFTGHAQVYGLVADRYGVEGTYQVAWGEIRGFVNHFKISQGDVPAPLMYNADNTLDNADLRLYTRWRRGEKRSSPSSARTTRCRPHGSLLLVAEGLRARLRRPRIRMGRQVLHGCRNPPGRVQAGGDASTAWLAAFSAKRWLGDDWAIGMTSYAQGGTKTAKYRAHGAGVTVEKLW
jgi:hypothetical protein